jgi:nucleotide-binding universal stress UspA family protein
MKHFILSKILVPMDFSEQSSYALDTAIALAQQQKASLTLLHVVNNTNLIVASPSSTTVGPVTEISAISREKLQDLCDNVSTRTGHPVDYTVEAGLPGDIICRFAIVKKFDLIVLGTKKKFAFTRLFRETVTYKVVKNAPCPVLSVPSTRLFRRFQKVIFPVRSSPGMLEKYEIARPILKTNSSTVHLAGLTRINDTDGLDRISSTMQVLRRKLQLDQIPYSLHVHFCDSVPDQLLQISSDEKPDLIVITATVEHWFKRIFLEYYAKVIVNRSPCPVLTFRPDMSQARQ